MEDNRKISLAIPVYNRYELLLESFEQVKDDPRISEICIFSDGSSKEFEKKYWDTFLKQETTKEGEFETTGLVASDAYPKVKLHLCAHNLGVYRAKKEAVNMASNEWIIVFDSDNKISPSYLDVLYNYKEWEPTLLYQPEFLMPHFDFRHLCGKIISRHNVAEILKTPNNRLDTVLNAMNCFVNKEKYLATWEDKEGTNGDDSIFFNYCWLKGEKGVFIVPGLHYFHRVEDKPKEQGSNYQSDRNAGAKVAKIIEQLRELR